MKKSTKFILLTIFALIVLIGLQSYSLLRIYKLEVDRFENLYRTTIIEGLTKFEDSNDKLGLGASKKALDLYAKGYLQILEDGKAKDTLVFRNLVLQTMHNEFEKLKNVDVLIKKILEKEDISTRFETYFVFRTFNLESYKNSLPIYNQKKDKDWYYLDTLGISDEVMYVDTYRSVGTNFDCTYDFYIDF